MIFHRNRALIAENFIIKVNFIKKVKMLVSIYGYFLDIIGNGIEGLVASIWVFLNLGFIIYRKKFIGTWMFLVL